MRRFLFGPVLGGLTAILLVLNISFWLALLLPVAVARLLGPVPAWQRACGRLMARLAEAWVRTSSRLLRWTLRTEWVLEVPEGLSREGWYLVISNHQSWVDILALFEALHDRVPFLRFFLKRELIWLPFVGIGAWALDFPFMRRYPKEVLEKRPELRGKDLETTRRTVERLRGTPVSILNFVEGTRFTPEKREAQQSPFRHLLIPRAGGISFVLEALGPQLRALLDATIVYPEGRKGFWDLLSGKVPRILVRVRRIEVPRDFFGGDYEDDPVFRERFQSWLRDLWREKDDFIDSVLHGRPDRRASSR